MAWRRVLALLLMAFGASTAQAQAFRPSLAHRLALLCFCSLSLAHPVSAQTNLALGRPATQSSTILQGSEASVCVDGNRTSGWCHTESQTNPWWQVDLGSNATLREIVVYNRADGYGAREASLMALISTDGNTWTRIYSHDGTNTPIIRINAGNRNARFVRLQLNATDYMNLLEVEVYGAASAAPPTVPTPSPSPTLTPAPTAAPVGTQGQANLALGRPATQSSTILPGSEASVCVDGNRTSGWCHTDSQTNPWWQVDLGSNATLREIVVYNRADGYGAREASLMALISTDGNTWTRIYSHDGTNTPIIRIKAGNRNARFVRLQLNATDYLNLLEVEVYGATSAAPPTTPAPAPPTPQPSTTPGSVPTSGPDFTGAWQWYANGFKGELYLTQSGSQIRGWIGFNGANVHGDAIVGSVSGKEIRFTRSSPRLVRPQEYVGYMLVANQPQIDIAMRMTGADAIGGSFLHPGNPMAGWYAIRIGPYRPDPR